jgi:hypothetical protein
MRRSCTLLCIHRAAEQPAGHMTRALSSRVSPLAADCDVCARSAVVPLGVITPDASLHSEDDRKALELAEQVRNMPLKRKSKNSVLQKASWALYRADTFKDILSDVADEVKNLEELLLAVDTARQQLANEEVDGLSTSTQLALLKESAASEEVRDLLLAAALDKKLAQTTGGPTTIYNNTFGSGNNGFQAGHVNGGTFTFGK